MVIKGLFLLHVRVAATRGQQAPWYRMGCSFGISAWVSHEWLEFGLAWSAFLEMIWMARRSESLFASFSSSVEKGLLLLNGTWGAGFIFLWDMKGPRLSAGVRKHWWVGGRVGARRSRHHEVGTL